MKWILICLISFSAQANEVQLTEEYLIKLSQKSNPSTEEIESSYIQSKVNYENAKDNLGFDLYSGVNHNSTKEKSTIAFQPVFKTINQYSVGIKKYTKYGVVLDAQTSVDQRSGSSESGSDYKDLHTTIYSLAFQVDLWKDLAGSNTRNQLGLLEEMTKKEKLQSEIGKSSFVLNVRKLYWRLVANNEKLQIYQNLLKTSNRQLADAKKRKANSITDVAEVARFESLVYQRKSQIILLEYEKQNLIKALRDLFPDLKNKEINLAKYNVNKTFFEVLSCSSKIQAQNNIPYEFTKYDDISKILKSAHMRQVEIDDKYDDIDLKMNLKVSQVGVSSKASGTNYSGDYNDSIKDMQDNDRGALSAGLMLTIPFGEDKGATVKVKEKLSKARFVSNIDKINAEVISNHKMVKKSVKLLAELIQNQKSNSKALSTRVKEMKKKYSQARIPEYALIQDEDSLLQSDLSVVDTQLQVVNLVLDYFTVFNSYPCAFNRNENE